MTNSRNYFATFVIYLLVSSGLLLLAFSLVHASEIQVKKFEKQVYSSIISKDDAVFRYDEFLDFLVEGKQSKEEIDISKIFTPDWTKKLKEIKKGVPSRPKQEELKQLAQRKILKERIGRLAKKLYEIEDGGFKHDLNLKTSNMIGNNLTKLDRVISKKYFGRISLSEYRSKIKNQQEEDVTTGYVSSFKKKYFPRINWYLLLNGVFLLVSMILGILLFLILLLVDQITDYFLDKKIFRVNYWKLQAIVTLLILVSVNGLSIFG